MLLNLKGVSDMLPALLAVVTRAAPLVTGLATRAATLVTGNAKSIVTWLIPGYVAGKTVSNSTKTNSSGESSVSILSNTLVKIAAIGAAAYVILGRQSHHDGKGISL